MSSRNKDLIIYQSSLHVKEGELVRYYFIITEFSLIENKILRCYTVELPLWTRWHRFEDYDYYHPMQN